MAGSRELRAPAAGEAQPCGRGRSRRCSAQVSRPPARRSWAEGGCGLQRGGCEAAQGAHSGPSGSESRATRQPQENIRGSGGVGGPGSVRYLNSTKEPPWSDWLAEWPRGGHRLSLGRLRVLLLVGEGRGVARTPG